MKALIFLALFFVLGLVRVDSAAGDDLDPDEVAHLRKAFAETQEEDDRLARHDLDQKEADIQIQMIILADDFATGRPRKVLKAQCQELMKDITSLAEDFSPNAKVEFLAQTNYKDQMTLKKCAAILPKVDHRNEPEPADPADAEPPEVNR